MQQPITHNDPKLFSSETENQYFDRKSARKDEREIAKILAPSQMHQAASWLSASKMMVR